MPNRAARRYTRRRRGWAGVIMNAWDVYGRQEITEDDIHREMDRLGK